MASQHSWGGANRVLRPAVGTSKRQRGREQGLAEAQAVSQPLRDNPAPNTRRCKMDQPPCSPLKPSRLP